MCSFFHVYLILVWLLHIVFLQVNGKYVIKSGTDFRHFSKIILNFDKASVDVSVEQIAVTSAYSEDPSLKQLLEKYGSKTETLDL
jgi:5'-nucleotidase